MFRGIFPPDFPLLCHTEAVRLRAEWLENQPHVLAGSASALDGFGTRLDVHTYYGPLAR